MLHTTRNLSINESFLQRRGGESVGSNLCMFTNSFFLQCLNYISLSLCILIKQFSGRLALLWAVAGEVTASRQLDSIKLHAKLDGRRIRQDQISHMVSRGYLPELQKRYLRLF